VSPTFGQIIRAARLGYHWSAKHGAMIRMSDCGPHTEVLICPPGQLPTHARENQMHRCWWECKEDCLSMIVPLRGIKAVKKPIRMLIDDGGNLVGGTHV
jgi:hypothetical protein